MKRSKTYVLLLVLLLSATFSCKKDDLPAAPIQSRLQVHAGDDIGYHLPSIVWLYGTVLAGSAKHFNWRQISGPSCQIETPGQGNSRVKVTTTGVYLFEFSASGFAVKAIDSVEITVSLSPDSLDYVDIYPSYHLLNLPQEQITLSAAARNFRPNIYPVNVASIQWTKIEGPAAALLNSPSTSTTTITKLEEGIYRFSCTMTSTTGFMATGVTTVAVANPKAPTREIILTNQRWTEGPWHQQLSITDIYSHLPIGKPIKKVFLKTDCQSQWQEMGLDAWPEIEEWGYAITGINSHLIIYSSLTNCIGDTPDVKIMY